MQAELVQLEKRLRHLEEEDNRKSDGNCSKYATDYYHLKHSYKDGDTTQLELINQIQGKLELYNRALIQQHKMSQIGEPDKFDVDDNRTTIYGDDMGYGAIIGEDSEVWGHPNNPGIVSLDLVGLYQRPSIDLFTRFASDNAMRFSTFVINSILKRDSSASVWCTGTVSFWTGMITSIVASLLPVVSILVLSNLKSERAELWTLAAFNVLLTVCLILCTHVKRAEVFAITAAFAAVQVVFLGTERIQCPSN